MNDIEKRETTLTRSIYDAMFDELRPTLLKGKAVGLDQLLADVICFLLQQIAVTQAQNQLHIEKYHTYLSDPKGVGE